MRLFKNTKQVVIWAVTFVVAIAAFYFSTIYGNKAAKDIKNTVEPVLTLTTDKVLLKVGDDFDVMSYIDTATNKYGEDISKKIKAPSIPTDVPGTYDIVYQYFDGRDLIKSKTLKVIIAEKVASESTKIEDPYSSDEKESLPKNETENADTNTKEDNLSGAEETEDITANGAEEAPEGE